MQIGEVAEGWWNLIFKPEDIEKEAQKRISICNLCEYKDTTDKACKVPLSNPCCSLCGCPIASKTRSTNSECPIGKWKAMNLNSKDKKDG